jgi:hypothetical protein
MPEQSTYFVGLVETGNLKSEITCSIMQGSGLKAFVLSHLGVVDFAWPNRSVIGREDRLDSRE